MKKVNKSKVTVSKKSEVAPKKLSKKERVLQNIEENESHIHEIDIIDLNKETIEEETAKELVFQKIPEEQIEIIDINSEEQSIFNPDLRINEQIDSETKDLQKKMIEITGDKGIISKEMPVNETVENIEIPSGERVKFYSNFNKEIQQIQENKPLDKNEIQQTKTVIYSNIPTKEGNYTEQDVNSAINELMISKNLSYLEAKAIFYDKIRKGEQLTKEIAQTKQVNQTKQVVSNIKVKESTKIYTNNKK